MNFLDDFGLSNKLWTLIKSKFGEKVDKTIKVNGQPLSSDVTITKSDVGLGNVNNTADKDKPVSTAQASAIAEATAAGTSAQTNLNTHISDKSNPHEVTKLQIGLGNVTNDAQVKRSEMGKASGVATLDSSGKVPSSQLPAYVDDVLEYTNKASFPTSGETGKIYVALDTNLTYRWSGSAYIEISPSIGLGETSSTAYPGNKGKKNADDIAAHIADTDNPHEVTKDQVGLSNVDNTSDANKPVSAATQTALNAKVDKTITINSHPLSSNVTITKSDVDLGNVDNTSDLNKPISRSTRMSLDALNSSINNHKADNTNPHNVTKEQLDLGNINNTSDIDKPVSTAQATAIADAKKAGTDAQTNINAHKSATNPHNITKATVGLGNVDNVKQVSASEKGAASGVATLDASSKIVQNIDASKITSGTISIDRLPKGALERLTVVANAAARKALTTATVQNGDTVKETDTGLMYYVKDETKLSTDAGWEVYTAGSAAYVPWSGVTGKPSTFTPSTHTHTKAQITDFPTALKNPGALTISLNGTNQGDYDGSSSKSINITAGSVGASPSNHTHPDKLNVDGSNGTVDGVSALIGKLGEGTDTPSDNIHFVCESTNGTSAYTRRKISALWNYIKGKCDALYATINTTFKLVDGSNYCGVRIYDSNLAQKAANGFLEFWHTTAGFFGIKAKRYISTVTTGTAPLEVNSTTVVTNLNADMVDGIQGQYLCVDAGAVNLKIGSKVQAITTAQFITLLTNLGAFNQNSWSCKGSWDYANNDIIIDTDCGNIQLAGATVEKVGGTNSYEIRVSTAPTTTATGAIKQALFIYRNNGSNYSPGWTRLINSTDKIANANNADVATKLGTVSVGNVTTPVYINAGTPTHCNLGFEDCLPKRIYSPTSGCLVTLSESATANRMINVRITGNSYDSNKLPFDTIVQFYNYNDSNQILNASAINNGEPISKISIFNYGGKICIWFSHTGSYQTFIVTAYSHYESNINKNIVQSIIDSAIPASGITRKVDIVPKNGYYTEATIFKSGLLSNTDKIILNGIKSIALYSYQTDTLNAFINSGILNFEPADAASFSWIYNANTADIQDLKINIYDSDLSEFVITFNATTIQQYTDKTVVGVTTVIGTQLYYGYVSFNKNSPLFVTIECSEANYSKTIIKENYGNFNVIPETNIHKYTIIHKNPSGYGVNIDRPFTGWKVGTLYEFTIIAEQFISAGGFWVQVPDMINYKGNSTSSSNTYPDCKLYRNVSVFGPPNIITVKIYSLSSTTVTVEFVSSSINHGTNVLQN